MRSIAAGCALVIVCAAGAEAQVLFGVRDQTPSGLDPRLVYEVTGGGPVPVGGGAGMGMLSPLDQLDDFGGVVPPPLVDISAFTFVMCFSVDRLAAGVPPPPIRALPPFNVFDQSQRGQQAADIYGTTEAFHRYTGRLGDPPGLGTFNNVLLRNQSAPYFVDKDFGLLPAGGPTISFPSGTPQDDVDGHAMRDSSGQLPKSYFTLSSTSPSLSSLGGTSGADIFFDTNITSPGSESVFAHFEQLGLIRADDIDGLAVYDDNLDGQFDSTDQVLFSLTPNSPTLAFIGAGPADILSFRADLPGLTIFETAMNLGLRPTDNIDALKLDPLLNDSVLDTLTAKLPAPSTAVTMVVSLGLAGARRRRV